MLTEQLALHKDSVALAASAEEIRNHAAQGIGSDLDGFSEPSEISCASQMGLLFSAMEKEFTPRQIDKFASGNVLRVLAEQ